MRNKSLWTLAEFIFGLMGGCPAFVRLNRGIHYITVRSRLFCLCLEMHWFVAKKWKLGEICLVIDESSMCMCICVCVYACCEICIYIVHVLSYKEACEVCGVTSQSGSFICTESAIGTANFNMTAAYRQSLFLNYIWDCIILHLIYNIKHDIMDV